MQVERKSVSERAWPARLRRALAASGVLLLSVDVLAQGPLQGPAQAVAALQQGGQVIVMRHASSPRAVPDKLTANPDNTTPERQLDEAGRNTAIAMGKALRALRIPIGSVLSSPTYRALETIRLAGFPAPQAVAELGDGGQSMQSAGASQGRWLQEQVTRFPKGSNTLLVTHFPNITAAFPEFAKDVADGEALIFGPDGRGGASLRARIRIEDWPALLK
jgi:phosphohistidine phosphatase SixA